MRALQWMLTLACVAIVATGCARNEESTTGPGDAGWTPPSMSGLSGAGLATHAAWVRAVNAGAAQPDEDIPAAFWADEIAALEPIRVYTHRANLVVAQRIAHGIEEGKYITLLISSYLPMQGVDGFTYSPDPQDNGQYHVHESLAYTRPLDE